MIRPYGKLLSRPFYSQAVIPVGAIGKSMLRLHTLAWTAGMRPFRFGGLSTCRVLHGSRFTHTFVTMASVLPAGRLRSRI